MQLVTEGALATPLVKPALNDTPAAEEARYAQYKVIRRNGSVVGFEPAKISIAVTKAFIAVNGGQGAASARVREQVAILTQNAVLALMRRQPSGGTFHIEDIQDQVELALMRSGEHNVARAYVLYREERAKERARERETQDPARRAQPAAVNVKEGGRVRPLDFDRITALVREACEGLGREVAAEPVLAAMRRDLYDGVPMEEVRKSLTLAARALIEQDPGYSYVTARLLLHSLRLETLGAEATQEQMHARYAQYLPEFVRQG
ncbi:MAG: ATP cone domain-containing protein, partial [Burkholderiales bacterium]